MAADFEASTFSARSSDTIMRFKYAKLLLNLANALEAMSGMETRAPGALQAGAGRRRRPASPPPARRRASREEDKARRGDLIRVATDRRPGPRRRVHLAEPGPRPGTVEADYLNGEIVLLGRQHGVPTPVNELLQRTANPLAAEQAPPGSVPIESASWEL